MKERSALEQAALGGRGRLARACTSIMALGADAAEMVTRQSSTMTVRPVWLNQSPTSLASNHSLSCTTSEWPECCPDGHLSMLHPCLWVLCDLARCRCSQ